jgi:hypothetical protein
VFEIGDIVMLKEGHHLSSMIQGHCIVDDIRKFQINTKRPNSYHIKTINVDSDGSHRMTWVKEDEITSISIIRNERLKELGI